VENPLIGNIDGRFTSNSSQRQRLRWNHNIDRRMQRSDWSVLHCKLPMPRTLFLRRLHPSHPVRFYQWLIVTLWVRGPISHSLHPMRSLPKDLTATVYVQLEHGVCTECEDAEIASKEYGFYESNYIIFAWPTDPTLGPGTTSRGHQSERHNGQRGSCPTLL
jgi:hypothetical protein